MAEQESNDRIEELKARLAADPQSRVFYQLGEELRKNGNPAGAEQVLRKGLETHPAYLSAWISLGRVLQDSSRPAEAVEVLNRAFEIDRQNVVVARLLGESHRAMGEDVEAIKKYKLVAALHPADEEVHDIIREIETQLASGSPAEVSSREAPSAPPEAELAAETPSEPDAGLAESMVGEGEPEPFGEEPQGEELEVSPDPEASGAAEEEGGEATLEQQPERESSAETSPAEEVAAEDGQDQEWSDSAQSSWGSEGNLAEGDGRAPEPSWTSAEDTDRQDDVSEDTELDAGEDDVVATVTMGDLYARQGHVEQAREIYRRVLEREPENAEASGRLELLSDDTDQPISSTKAKVVRLEQWLSKIRD
jgi:tetratricopeptide (TPR) repeat protein